MMSTTDTVGIQDGDDNDSTGSSHGSENGGGSVSNTNSGSYRDIEEDVDDLDEEDLDPSPREDSDDEAEAASLMGSDGMPRRKVDKFEDEHHFYYDEEDEDRQSGSFRNLVCVMTCVLIIAMLAVLLPGIGPLSKRFKNLTKPSRIPVEFHCPSTVVQADNYDESFSENYGNVTEDITNNMTEFLETFREKKFDDWGKSYDDVKQGMYDFKSKYFPEYLEDGYSIYESACGIGLNLYMTLEIVKEVKGVENLFIYGNEYLPDSAKMANTVMDHIAPAHATKGVICAADSAELSFVPSNSFDLVYTGYISPKLDPLDFHIGNDNNFMYYTTLCESNEGDWQAKKLEQIGQQIQDDWYGKWVGEMARIAKPGVPVIVEQVSPRFCDAHFDWGGVNRQWWYDSAQNNTYDWNVDPTSIAIEDDKMFRDRYHVFMLKKGHRPTK